MGYTGQAAATNNLAELDDCFAKSLSTGKEVLSLWELDGQSCQNKNAVALELKAFLEGCGCYGLTPCLLHFQKRTSVGCIYRQTISSGDTSYQVHRIAVLGSLPRKALERGFAHQQYMFSVAGYYAKGSERFAPLGPMWFLGAKEPDAIDIELRPRADKPIRIEILDLAKALV